MSPDTLLSLRELDARIAHGVHVRLLWSADDDRIWVAVVDVRSGESFCLLARDGESAHELFHHPYAYIETHRVYSSGPVLPVLAPARSERRRTARVGTPFSRALARLRDRREQRAELKAERRAERRPSQSA